tara:strand:+ start:262 stop:681 length:420 start_codon:yes stop_codon:yes gene_type:complete
MRTVPQLIAKIKSDATLNTTLAGQVFADYAPQGSTEPFVVVSVTSTDAYGTVNNCPVRAYTSRIEFDTLATSRSQAEEIADQLEDLLDGYTTEDSGFPIQGITLDGGASWDLLTPKDGSDQRLFVCSQDYAIHYRRNLS